MHGIQELWALQQCARPDVDLPDWLPADLERVAVQFTLPAKLHLSPHATVDEVLDAAQEGARRAHLFAAQYGLTRPEAHIAEVLRRSYTNIFRTALAKKDGGPSEYGSSRPNSTG
jgi:hypothetical protein